MRFKNFLFKADLLQKSTRILTGCISILLFFTVSTFSLISSVAAEIFILNHQSNFEKTVKYKTYFNHSIPSSHLPEIYENTNEYAEELEEDSEDDNNEDHDHALAHRVYFLINRSPIQLVETKYYSFSHNKISVPLFILFHSWKSFII